jgi:hypothetical protein
MKTDMRNIISTIIILIVITTICQAQSPASFKHPGIFSGQAQLDFIKNAVAANNGSPIVAGYQTLANDSKGSLSYNPEPYAVVAVVASGSGPEEAAFRRDAHAAYIHAIKWVVTGNTAHRDKSIQILNAWSYAFQSMYCTDPNKPNQTTLEASWALPIWLAGAEIIKSYNSGSAGWASADVTKFESYVRKILTYVNGQIASAPNWYISKGLSLMAAGVYLNDAANYNAGYNIITPQLDAITTSGQIPELTRDFVHSQYVLIGLTQAAEVAYQQGSNALYTRTNGASQPRLLLGAESYTRCLLGTNTPNYQTDSQWARKSAPYEILLLRYNQLGMSVPNVQNYVINQNRSEDGAEDHFLGWLTATHSALPPAGCSGSYTNVPATIQAENFCQMSGIQTETTTDSGGGQNVGYVDTNDWMEYRINVPSTGTYTVQYRVASANGGGSIRFEKFGGGTTFGTISVPSTGGWQTWTTISQSVQLTAGQQDVAIAAAVGGFNINWFAIVGATPTFSQTVQAESYNDMLGVQTETTTDAGGGQNVGWIDTNDWMKYNNITIPSTGAYKFEYRVASPNSTGVLSQDLNSGAIQLGTIAVPNTGGWQTWTTISRTVNLNAGTYNFGIFASAGGWNINWWKISTSTGGRIATAEETTAEVNSDLTVFPNPSSGSITIRVVEPSHVNILDVSGKSHFSMLVEKSVTIDHLNSGLYIVKMKNSHKTVAAKLYVK